MQALLLALTLVLGSEAQQLPYRLLDKNGRTCELRPPRLEMAGFLPAGFWDASRPGQPPGRCIGGLCTPIPQSGTWRGWYTASGGSNRGFFGAGGATYLMPDWRAGGWGWGFAGQQGAEGAAGGSLQLRIPDAVANGLIAAGGAALLTTIIADFLRH